tara:strand:- start:2095 stop:2853 length:759 start_codon:yes stop_codon:yes gene_type:complete
MHSLINSLLRRRPQVPQGQPVYPNNPNTRVINEVNRNNTIIELTEAIKILISSFPNLRQLWSEHSEITVVNELTTFFQFISPPLNRFQDYFEIKINDNNFENPSLETLKKMLKIIPYLRNPNHEFSRNVLRDLTDEQQVFFFQMCEAVFGNLETLYNYRAVQNPGLLSNILNQLLINNHHRNLQNELMSFISTFNGRETVAAPHNNSDIPSTATQEPTSLPLQDMGNNVNGTSNRETTFRQPSRTIVPLYYI